MVGFPFLNKQNFFLTSQFSSPTLPCLSSHADGSEFKQLFIRTEFNRCVMSFPESSASLDILKINLKKQGDSSLIRFMSGNKRKIKSSKKSW